MKRMISILCTLTLIFSVIFTISLPVNAATYDIVIDFENETTGSKPNGWKSVDSDLVSFSDSNGSDLGIYSGQESDGKSIACFGDNTDGLVLDFSIPMFAISLEFGNDNPGFITSNDWAILTLFNGATQIDQVMIHPNVNDLMDQTISYSGSSFTKAVFAYSTNLTEVVDNIMLASGSVVTKNVVPGNHELVTLLTNPMDTSGVRTMDLNYYMNDPIIWGTDVKNITVWLETEIFDLAVAKQKAKLPVGLMLLKDYNIRLMMKVVYNDGTVETKEVDNAHIARNIPVLIPADEFAGTSDLGIVYMDTEGNTAVLPVTPVTIDGMNYLKFENNHFSEYGVVSGTAQAPAQQQYIIQPGDTLASIATKFGKTVQSLATANNISNPDMIYASKILIIA